MSNKNDGGPAFPVIRMSMDPDTILNRPGMSLRDWFAGQALCGDLAANTDYAVEWRNDKNEVRLLDYGHTPVDDGTNWKRISGHAERLARQCYVYADAMMKARDTK